MFGQYSRSWCVSLAGMLFFVAGLVAFLGIVTAETLYPGYSTSENEISDLGATRPPNSIIEQPSSNIFSGSMIMAGLLMIAGTYCIYFIFKKSLVTISVGMFGVGVLGVGVFNGSWGSIHATFALITFVSGAIAAIVAYKVESFPLRYISVVLGTISLVTLLSNMFLGDSNPLNAMGIGGVERWVAYPILLWLLGFGGYLMGNVHLGIVQVPTRA